MAKQIHKHFTNEQVKELLQKYLRSSEYQMDWRLQAVHYPQPHHSQPVPRRFFIKANWDITPM
jgi:hypothetical protein